MDSTSLPTDEELAQAIASRICHDLVSPVGALANGADLLGAFGPSKDGEEVRMIAQSAERAAALLDFFRLAFGAAPPDAAMVARNTAADTLSRMLASTRITVDVCDVAGGPLPRANARLVALMALSARTVLGMRGGISVQFGTGAPPISVSAAGEVDATRHAELADRLAGGTGRIEPSRVEFALLPGAARQIGAVLRIETSGDSTGLGAPGGLTLHAEPA